MRRVAARIEVPEGGGGRPAGRVIPLRSSRFDGEGMQVLELVARARQVPAGLLLHRSRCTADIAAARQLAMYLMHVSLQRNYARVGRFFGRDRTTVAHACAQIEDLRDDPDIDAEVTALEAALAAHVDDAEACYAAG